MTLTRETLLLRPDEAAELLQVSRSKIYALVNQGRIPAVRLTGSVRIPRAPLEQMVREGTVWPTGGAS